jgi:plasmid stabilization system protein ParE
MASNYIVYWTDESLSNLEAIIDYFNKNWTNRELENFKRKLGRQIELIEKKPKIFPVSQFNPRLRKAVLSKQTTIFFELTDKAVYITYLFSNRQNINKIK